MINFFRKLFCFHKHWARYNTPPKSIHIPTTSIYTTQWICMNCGKIESRLKGKDRKNSAYHYDKKISSEHLEFGPYTHY